MPIRTMFNLQVIAGINSTETEVVQHGAKFRLDFAKVSASLSDGSTLQIPQSRLWSGLLELKARNRAQTSGRALFPH